MAMLEAAGLVQELQEIGRIRVLDLAQTAQTRGGYQPWNHDGLYYILPPEGTSATGLDRLFDKYREADALHFLYNAQTELDTVHKPILSMDTFAETHFGAATNGMVKVTAVSRSKVAEVNALIDAFKLPFDAATFPMAECLVLTAYKPSAEGRQGSVSIAIMEGDWKELRDLEEAIRTVISESNMVREVVVTRHSVKGLESELILSTTEESTEKGDAFLADLALHLQELDRRGRQKRSPKPAEPEALEKPKPENRIAAVMLEERARREQLKKTAEEPHVMARDTLSGTLASRPSFRALKQTYSGTRILVEFPKPGLFGIGGFSGKHAKELQTVYKGVRRIPELEAGWSAFYHYDKGAHTLTIDVVPPASKSRLGWIELK